MIHGAVTTLREGGRTAIRWADHPGTPQRLGSDPADPLWVIAKASEGYVASPDGCLNIHATGSETVLVARYFADLVSYDALEHLPPAERTATDLAEWRKGGDAARRITPDGYFGTPWTGDLGTWQFYERTASSMADAIGAHLEANAN